MFCSEAFLVIVTCLKLHWHLEFFLRFRAEKVLMILICPIKQLAVRGWMAGCYIANFKLVRDQWIWPHFFSYKECLFVINLSQLQTHMKHRIFFKFQFKMSTITSSWEENLINTDIYKSCTFTLLQTDLVEIWHVVWETLSHSTVTSWP